MSAKQPAAHSVRPFFDVLPADARKRIDEMAVYSTSYVPPFELFENSFPRLPFSSIRDE